MVKEELYEELYDKLLLINKEYKNNLENYDNKII